MGRIVPLQGINFNTQTQKLCIQNNKDAKTLQNTAVCIFLLQPHLPCKLPVVPVEICQTLNISVLIHKDSPLIIKSCIGDAATYEGLSMGGAQVWINELGWVSQGT